MNTIDNASNGTLRQLVMVRPDPSGQFRAEAVGLPDVCACADTSQGAIDRVHEMLNTLLAAGQLVAIDVEQNPLLNWAGHVDPNDPDEKAYLDALAEARKADLEETLRELD